MILDRVLNIEDHKDAYSMVLIYANPWVYRIMGLSDDYDFASIDDLRMAL